MADYADLVNVDSFGKHGTKFLSPSHRLGLVVRGGGGIRRFRLGDVHVVAVAVASTSQEQHGPTSRSSRLRGAVVRRRLRRDGRFAVGALRAAETAQSTADVLVEEAESRSHDEAEVRQSVQCQRNANDCVQHRHQPSAVCPRCDMPVTYTVPTKHAPTCK